MYNQEQITKNDTKKQLKTVLRSYIFMYKYYLYQDGGHSCRLATQKIPGP